MNLDLPLLAQLTEFATARQITLPVFSDVALQLQAASQSDHYDISTIERAVDSDPALAAEILRAANSAFFGGLAEVSTIKNAILRLGFKQVTNLAFMATEKNRYTARHPQLAVLMKDLWRHASASALASEWLARRLRYAQLAEQAFIGGLLHDIGKLFLLRVLDEMVRENPREGLCSLELVHEVLTQAHTEQGYLLLQSWNLPPIYLTIVRDHHSDTLDTSDVPQLIVRLANHACHKVGIGFRCDPSMELIATAEAHALGVNDVTLAELEIILEDAASAAA